MPHSPRQKFRILATNGKHGLIRYNSLMVKVGTDPRNGDLIFCDIAGAVKRLARSGTTGTAPPATLSATGVFSNVASLAPNAGVCHLTPVNPWC